MARGSIRLDTLFPGDPRVSALSDRAFRAHFRLACYIAEWPQHFPDGKIALDLAQIVARHTQRKDARSIQELVDAGLWVVDDSGWIGLADDSRTKILMPDTARTSVSRHLEHLLERDEWTCGICQNVLETGTEMHVDHIIPRSRGGDDCLSNLQPAHARCNIWKGSRLESELDLAEMGA